MAKPQDDKKCFCARCFLPIDAEDRVDIEGQNFHRICSMCCICRTIPSSLKMFYGHVFCSECFKTHVMTRFKGESPRMHSNSWWMQWAPGAKPQQKEAKEKAASENTAEEPSKRCICSRCLLPVDESEKVTIGDQNFHTQCAQCYFCHSVPTSNVKIYYGQVFCEECFHRHVLNRNRDNPSEFFKNCFVHWQNNAQFAENMREFMAGKNESAPFIFMMQGNQPPFCRCGTGPQDWFSPNEPKKSATPATISNTEDSLGTWDLSFENRTEVSDIPESSANDESANHENLIVAAAEKIEKLTKYLHERDRVGELENFDKKWKTLERDSSNASDGDSFYGWVDLQEPKRKIGHLDCPKCLWQCGPIYVNSEYLQKQVACGEN